MKLKRATRQQKHKGEKLREGVGETEGALLCCQSENV